MLFLINDIGYLFLRFHFRCDSILKQAWFYFNSVISWLIRQFKRNLIFHIFKFISVQNSYHQNNLICIIIINLFIGCLYGYKRQVCNFITVIRLINCFYFLYLKNIKGFKISIYLFWKIKNSIMSTILITKFL